MPADGAAYSPRAIVSCSTRTPTAATQVSPIAPLPAFQTRTDYEFCTALSPVTPRPARDLPAANAFSISTHVSTPATVWRFGRQLRVLATLSFHVTIETDRSPHIAEVRLGRVRPRPTPTLSRRTLHRPVALAEVRLKPVYALPGRITDVAVGRVCCEIRVGVAAAAAALRGG